MNDEYSSEDLRKGMGAFLMCFGQGLPAALKESIRQRAYRLAEEIEQGGEPSVATLTRDFADALVATTRPTTH